MTTSSIEKLKDLGIEARKAGLYAKAARFYQQAGKLAEESRNEKERVECLFWEGYCLYLAGETDAAMPLLMEAANCRSPEADPADVFNASTMLIEISLDQKSASFCRKLITQTRNWLAGINKTNWQHNLDWLEGKLEFARGNFATAYPMFVQAREGERQNPYYPAYTQATYLRYLCITAFYLHDTDSLKQWTEIIEVCEKNHEYDKVYAKHARLCLFRTERSVKGNFSHASELAISLLDMLKLFEAKDTEFYESVYECLRILMLARRWQDFDHQLERFSLKEDFAYFLFRGDEHLCRARESLGMAVKDDQWDMDFPLPEPDMPDAESGLNYLKEAAAFYEKAREEAQAKDERLETEYYTATLNGRLERVRAMENAVLAYLAKI